MSQVDFSTVKVVSRFPNYLHLHDGKPIPNGLVGSKILRIGAVGADKAVEGGGLVIDYLRRGSRTPQRIVLAFNELGMWVEYAGRLKCSAIQDESQE